MATIEEYQSIPIEDKLRRAAHHEAGHIVVAAQQGLHLRSDGIGVDPVGEGLACYWKEPEDNDSSRISVIVSTFAGFNAEKEFCQLHSLPILEDMWLILSPDWNEARQIITSISSLSLSTTVVTNGQRAGVVVFGSGRCVPGIGDVFASQTRAEGDSGRASRRAARKRANAGFPVR